MADDSDETSKPKPAIRLVSSQPLAGREEADRKRSIEFAKLEVDNRLTQLAANIMRVTRGAGRAYEIPRQIHDCALAMEEYRKAAGFGLSDHEVSEILSVKDSLFGKNYSEAEVEWICGIEAMMRGGLQTAASRLLEQRTQENSGESEMLDGIKSIERSRELHQQAFSRDRRGFTSRTAQVGKTKPPVNHRKAADSAKQLRQPRSEKPKPLAPPSSPPTPPKGPRGKKASGHKAVLAAYKAARGIE